MKLSKNTKIVIVTALVLGFPFQIMFGPNLRKVTRPLVEYATGWEMSDGWCTAWLTFYAAVAFVISFVVIECIGTKD